MNVSMIYLEEKSLESFAGLVNYHLFALVITSDHYSVPSLSWSTGDCLNETENIFTFRRHCSHIYIYIY